MNMLMDKVLNCKRELDRKNNQEERILNLGRQNLAAILKTSKVPGVSILPRYQMIEKRRDEFVICIEGHEFQNLYLKICPLKTKQRGAPVYILKASRFFIQGQTGNIQEMDFHAHKPTNTNCIYALERALYAIGNHIAHVLAK